MTDIYDDDEDFFFIPKHLQRAIQKKVFRPVSKRRPSVRRCDSKKRKPPRVTYTPEEFNYLYHSLGYTKTVIHRLKKTEVKRIIAGDIAPHIWSQK